MINHKQYIGRCAELKARRYLESQGLDFIESNFSCYYGEIDLIMKDHTTLVFVEVRFRQKNTFTTAVETIQLPKQQRIIRTALRYLQKNNAYDQSDSRFDVVGLDHLAVTWIKDAFQVQ